jgi:hypothetical protein
MWSLNRVAPMSLSYMTIGKRKIWYRLFFSSFFWGALHVASGQWPFINQLMCIQVIISFKQDMIVRWSCDRSIDNKIIVQSYVVRLVWICYYVAGWHVSTRGVHFYPFMCVDLTRSKIIHKKINQILGMDILLLWSNWVRSTLKCIFLLNFNS